MVLSIAHWGYILEMINLHYCLQGEDFLEHTNAKCHLYTLLSTCRLVCNTCIHLITLVNIHTPAKMLVSTLDNVQVS